MARLTASSSHSPGCVKILTLLDRRRFFARDRPQIQREPLDGLTADIAVS
jgi:hypothetical protein